MRRYYLTPVRMFIIKKTKGEIGSRWQSRSICSHSLPLARAPESQLTAEQSSTGRHWNSPKRYTTSKDKGEATWDSRRGTITIKSNFITAGLWNFFSQTVFSHKLENTYTTEVHPLEWRFWTPRQAFQPGGPAMGGGIPRESDFEG